MAETTKKTTKKTTEKNTVAKKETPKMEAVEKTEAIEKKVTYKVRQELDPHMLVTVRNGFHGRLIYIDRKTREEYIWEEFGDEQDIELIDLKYAKSSAKKFFTENWFIIEDPVVVEHLGLEQYYKGALDVEGFEDLFVKDPKEIEKIVAGLSNGQKRTVMYRARQAITEGTIDSLRVISALEKALGIELVER